MTDKALEQILRNGESSTIEFKRDSSSDKKFNEKLVKEIIALLNSKGGTIFIGVEDTGYVTGIQETSKKLEELIMELCQNHIVPPYIPQWETYWYQDKRIGIIKIECSAPDKPYQTHKSKKIYIRVGTTSREASREEVGRLYAHSSVGGAYLLKPVRTTTIKNFDMRRVFDYFSNIREIKTPKHDDIKKWESLLHNHEFLADDGRATIAGALLFIGNLKTFLPHAGVTLAVFKGTEKNTPATAIQRFNTSLLRLSNKNNDFIESGLVELCLDFIKSKVAVQESTTSGVRKELWDYPISALRELIVNALVHRDYSLPTDVEISIYQDRIEIISPGALPNSITVQRMKTGCRASRTGNEILRDIMSEYRYIEGVGRGVSTIVIPEMKKNNKTTPVFKEEETRLIVILKKDK